MGILRPITGILREITQPKLRSKIMGGTVQKPGFFSKLWVNYGKLRVITRLRKLRVITHQSEQKIT